jgi:hypothetical protein
MPVVSVDMPGSADGTLVVLSAAPGTAVVSYPPVVEVVSVGYAPLWPAVSVVVGYVSLGVAWLLASEVSGTMPGSAV